MALQFVLGSSGSGKTEYIYERLVRQAGEHPKKNYLVIVPEQFTMQTQQKLVELAPNHAIMNIDVLSFKRLAYRVFDDMGMQDIQVLEETGKNLVLRRLAQEQEETLTVFRANMNRMGYIGEVKSMISELVQYRISPEQLVDLTEDKTISPVLSAKLRDVATMYRAFCDFMKDSFVTAEEILNVLKNLVPQSETLRDAVLNDKYSWNSLYVYLKYKVKDTKKIPFIDTMSISLDSPHTLHISVYEKGMLGYIYIPGINENAYFDKDGFVVETSSDTVPGVPCIDGISCDKVVLYEDSIVRR